MLTRPQPEQAVLESPAAQRRPVVVLVEPWIYHYRQPFLEVLRRELDERGIEFRVVHGRREQDKRRDTVTIPWAEHVDARAWHVGSKELLWQPCFAQLEDADLVIVHQEVAQLMNFVHVLFQLVGRRRLAFWGHGKNFQTARASVVGEAIKRWMSRRVHWWFAYNELSQEIVRGLGYPAERITNVQNAIDTEGLVEARTRLADEDIRRVLDQHGIRGERLAVYAGGLYHEKRLPLLLSACDLVQQQLPDFELVVIGSGPQEGLIEQAAARRPWLHYVGPRFGADKVPYFAAARLALMPGLVGLVVLDAFALETPLVTIADSLHSPEIAYLVDGENGTVLRAGAGPRQYADEVVRLLCDDAARATLTVGCRRARCLYTVEEMARRFAAGVEAALRAA